MKKLKPFKLGPVTARSMPFWCVANPIGDPFGPGVLGTITSIQACGLICEAAGKGLIEMTSAHDDDLIPWDPKNPEKITPKDIRTLRKIRGMLDDAGVKFNTITCNLHGNPVFRNGGLANPDPAIRALAHAKTRRTLVIGNILDASYFTYWVARDGYEVAAKVVWDKIYPWIAEGLNSARRYIKKMNFNNYRGGTIEAKPNEPRGSMFLPTSDAAVAFIQTMLDDPDFWGVNPEVLQHEKMALVDVPSCIARMVSMKKLTFLHFGGQISGQFDNDFPPLVGPQSLQETVIMFHVLMVVGWSGTVEYDCHMLRPDADSVDPIGCRRQFIADCSTGLTLAVMIAKKIRRLEGNTLSLSHTRAEYASIMAMCSVVPHEISSLTRKSASLAEIILGAK